MAKAKIKAIKDGTGGSSGDPTVTITDVKTGTDYDYSTPYVAQLAFNVGDEVRYDTATVPGTSTTIVTYVERITSGQVVSVNSDNATGMISEKLTGKSIPFYQPGLSELGITKGTYVKYDLVTGPLPPTIASSGSSSGGSVSASSGGTITTDSDVALNVKIDPAP